MTIQQKFEQIENGDTFEQMTKSEFTEFIKNVANGSHNYASMISLTIPSMNKTNNPFYGRVVKIAKWSFGCNTSSKVKGQSTRNKNGVEGEYVPQKSYVNAVDGDVNFTLCENMKDASKLYMRVYTNANQNSVSFSEYYIDGVKATEFELEQLKTFVKKSTKGSNNLGVKGDDAHGTFNVSLPNIKYIYIVGRKIKVV